ncbi:related to Probable tRNA threonylcarbamoyladenosine biosynthesis protein QRI7, mitochondrial [Saccharomycodes ludwigii]|uniref:N(6)-L-threonylcarbamoyladenine synthase n=1 Tax=Saccharomycodes ludwigii TaxID=36035 RepID=A0A376B7I2_9ASCO|nr:hypothetical protein SCDLUD_002690 [Saccharomycodes ludwigii]KAH3901204.1 hypothetical protein SCDLUD_002690 [Saccharomycodes ludwigii]SSD60645.1 related to Probable tRNA threonylcarbamoyladenosine biosynthesis protein QRI7, mitochondrial [Saccharomycodes ludwigii]
MLTRNSLLRFTPQSGPPFIKKRRTNIFQKSIKTLAVETSCDDTCVAILEDNRILCNLKKTLSTVVQDGGIIPTKAHVHHQQSLAPLVREALTKANINNVSQDIDLICVTRGPGMPGSLSVGLDFCKGLSIGANNNNKSAPKLIGVHHMLGHLLIPLMFDPHIKFPLCSLLCSGGHTVFVYSHNYYTHEIICDTVDIAIGDSLDKCGRELGIRGNMIAKEMEKYITSNRNIINTNAQNIYQLPKPLSNKAGRKNVLAFSFAGYISAVRKMLSNVPVVKYPEFAYHIQETAFQHLIDKIKLSIELGKIKTNNTKNLQFVCSGGVGSNMRLRKKLEDQLPFKSFHYPPLDMCTDNAVMIGWAGMKLYESLNGVTTDLGATPLKKWSLPDLLKVDGWCHTNK